MDEQTWSPPANDAIRAHTSDASNRRIDRTTVGALEQAAHSPPQLRERLAELDREWTIDRALMLNFAVAAGISGALAMRSPSRRGRLGWGLVFWTQIGFLANHAIRRWCPPLPVFRRLGYRSDHEIAAERTALELRLAEASSL